MKRWMLWSVSLLAMSLLAQETGAPKPPATLRSILLMELRETHNQKNWFVSGKEAVAGLTQEQAAWSDGKNHSVGQLVQHLIFWNSFNLASFKGEHPPQPGNNDNTFKYDPQQWEATRKQFDDVMDEWEHVVEKADEATLAKNASLIAHISEHNAYHIGEIIAVRKAHGMWDAALGVN